jgi:hypothetical protein
VGEVCEILSLLVSGRLEAVQVSEGAYQLDPGSEKVKVGDFCSIVAGKIPPSINDLFWNVDGLPLRVVAHGSPPFPRKSHCLEESVSRAHVPPIARLLSPER